MIMETHGDNVDRGGAEPDAIATIGAQVDELFSDFNEHSDPVELAALEKIGTRWRFRLDPAVALAISGLVRTFADILAAADPEQARPALYLDDVAAEAEWQARGDSSLLDGRRSATTTLIAALEGAPMSEADCLACVRAITDLRLRIFRVAGEPDAWEEADPADQAHAIFVYLGWLATNLLGAVGAIDLH